MLINECTINNLLKVLCKTIHKYLIQYIVSTIQSTTNLFDNLTLLIYIFILLYIYYYIQKIINKFLYNKKRLPKKSLFVCEGIRICSLILHGRNRKDLYRFGL